MTLHLLQCLAELLDVVMTTLTTINQFVRYKYNSMSITVNVPAIKRPLGLVKPIAHRVRIAARRSTGVHLHTE